MRSQRNFVDTIETQLRKFALVIFLLGVMAFMTYHFCYTLIPRLIPGEWSLGVFGYEVANQSDLLSAVVDVAVRDVIPISITITSLFATRRTIKRYKLTPLSQYSEGAFELVQDLADKSALNIHETYVMQTSEANAFIFGIRKINLALTSRTVDILTRDETEAVILHELSHVLNKDHGFMTWGNDFSRTLLRFFPVMCVYEIFFSLWFEGPLWALISRLAFIIMFLFVVPLALLNSISRKREFLADARASLMMQSKEQLEDALLKIDASNANAKKPKPHSPKLLSIADTSNGKLSLFGRLARFVAHHPSPKERIISLQKGEYVGGRTEAPDYEAAAWIGILAAMITALGNEFVSQATKNLADQRVWEVAKHSWMALISDFWNTAIILVPPIIIALLYAVHLRRYIGTSQLRDNVYDNSPEIPFRPYFSKVWKSLTLCFAAFDVIFIPWHSFLGWWGFTFLLGESVPRIPMMDPHFLPRPIPNFPTFLAVTVLCWPFLTVLLIILIGIIWEGASSELSKDLQKATKSISKSFIEANFPEESPFFDRIWNALEKMPRGDERDAEKIRKELPTFIDPTAVSSFVTPIVISIVAGILSTFVTDIIKRELRRKKASNHLKRIVFAKVSQDSADFKISKDLAVKIASYTIEYLETH